MHYAKRGRWHLPEDQTTQRLERAGKALGYYPVGVDVDTDPSHQDGSVERGLFCNKGHVLFGKVPPKEGMGEDRRQWLFVKCEQFGNQQVADTIGHTANLGKTIAGVKKHAHGGAKRQEKPDKETLKEFNRLVEGAFGFTVSVLDTQLTEDELGARAKVVGYVRLLATTSAFSAFY